MLVHCECGWEKTLKDELAGKKGQCPKCGTTFVLRDVPLTSDKELNEDEAFALMMATPVKPPSSPQAPELLDDQAFLTQRDFAPSRRPGNPSASPRKKMPLWLTGLFAGIPLVFVGAIWFFAEEINREAANIRAMDQARKIAKAEEDARDPILAPLGSTARSKEGAIGVHSMGLWKRVQQLLSAQDVLGLDQLVQTGQVVLIPAGTELRKIATEVRLNEYRIESGPGRGMSLWIAHDWVEFD